MYLDMILSFFGVVKKSKYLALIEYSNHLAVAAKKSGASILMKDESITHQDVIGDTFLHGGYNRFHSNKVLDGKVFVNPASNYLFNGLIFDISYNIFDFSNNGEYED